EAEGHVLATEARTIPYFLLIAAGLGIFAGCVGKSAQFPLQTWLPDAMEGPTPVSALVHSATMVAAGVYLVGRFYPMFTPEVLLTIAYVGCVTAFMAATIAVVATDIKKVLAYSTISQLGYMMLGLGVGGWGAGLFHLVTHAFFKSLMFLASGSVIHGCHHVQEMPQMGGLRKKMPITAIAMLVGVIAIAGLAIPGTPIAFSGYHSKDAVVASALTFSELNPAHFLLFYIPLAGAGITAFYMFRLWFYTFAGEPRDAHVYEHAHESPAVM
ncbi:MAG: proton-conducting transporter membrane subunit, partial [Planctomycetaceae bacterium]